MRPVLLKHTLFTFCLFGLIEWTVNPIYAQTNFSIAFGSCSHQDDKEQMWDDIIKRHPNLWIWIGDNIYADTHNMDSMQMFYSMQKARADYQKMLRAIPIIGTWDDHDYGVNDGGKYFSKKKESKERLLEFLDVPPSAEVRKHDGVYQSFTYGSGKHKIRVILLDTRSFRDTLTLSDEKGKKYTANSTGDILGEEQWQWLEKELSSPEAKLHIIASSIQFLSNEHGYEKWGNFPKARARMLDLLQRVKPANTLFVSGDRHIAEISKIKLQGLKYPLYDFTSSGLTHTWSEPGEESNALRVGELVIQKNYGMILINWNKKGPIITLQVRGSHDALFAVEKIDFSIYP